MGNQIWRTACRPTSRKNKVQKNLNSRSALGYREYLIDFYVFQHLPDAARPCEFNAIDDPSRAQPKVHTLITGRTVAHSGRRVVVLNAERSLHLDLCAQAIAIGFDPDQLQNDPVVAAALKARVVHPYFRRTIQDRDHGIDLAIVVEIAKRRAAMRCWNRKRFSRLCTHILENHPAFVAKHTIGKCERPVRQLHGIIQNVGVGGEQIFVSVVVEIENPRSPRR